MRPLAKILIALAVVLIAGLAVGLGAAFYLGSRTADSERRASTSTPSSATPRNPAPAMPVATTTGTVTPAAPNPMHPPATATTPAEPDDAPLPPPWSPDANFEDVPGSFEPGQKLVDSCPPTAEAQPPMPDSAPGLVPLRAGLTLVDAWHRFNGDVEEVTTVKSIDGGDVNIAISGLTFPDDTAVEGTEATNPRRLCRRDLLNAAMYMTEFRATYPEIIPGATNFSMPARRFQGLKTTGTVPWSFLSYIKNPYTPRYVPLHLLGELHRAEPATVPFAIVVNDQRVNLPTVHVTGTFILDAPKKVRALVRDRGFYQQAVDAYILDDATNPMCLLFAMGPVFKIQIVKISFPPDKPRSLIAEHLEKEKRAVVYGIYFDFNKDTIKPQSEPVLLEIAQALRDHPDWQLKVEGHTDNLGGDAYNLQLSERRAASVKRALVERYQIAASRLTPSGFGASRPVDTNETLEGRARNRRVELSRE